MLRARRRKRWDILPADMEGSGGPDDPRPLNGWKEIAGYLGKSLRSVQRYERELGLPVRRLKSADGQTVYAFRHEIDAWRLGLDDPSKVDGANGVDGADDDKDIVAPPAHRLDDSATPRAESGVRRPLLVLWWGLSIIGAVCVGLLGRGFFTRATTTPLSGSAVFTLNAQRLEVRRGDGQLMWSHAFDREVSGVPAMDRAHSTPSDLAVLADIDGDGSPEAIVPVRFSAAGQKSTESDRLFAFSQDGTVRWEVTPPESLACTTEKFNGPWQIRSVKVSDKSGRKKVWVAFNHNTWWPGFVLEIDPDGSHLLRYLQTGWIYTLSPWNTKAGSYLVAGGVTNDGDQPVLTILDLSKPATVSPSRDPRFSCPVVASASPTITYLLPNDELTRMSNRVYTHVDRLSVEGEVLKVTLVAGEGARIVNVAPDFSITAMSFSDSFWFNHRAFEETGLIRHPATKCPELGPQLITKWTPKTGWEQLHVTPTLRTTLPGTIRH